MNTNFERITRKAPTEGFTGRKGAKLNKRDRKAERDNKRASFDNITNRAELKYTKCGKQYREDRY